MPVYRKPKLLKPGEYGVEVKQAYTSRSVLGGNEMVIVFLSAKNDEGQATSFRDYLVFNEKAYWKFESFLKAVGLDLEDGEEIDADDFVGLTARVQVGIKEFGNREQNFVERWLPKVEDACAAV
jgi:hypothetical protein